MEEVAKKMNSMLLENPPSGDLSVLFFFFFLRGDFVLLSEIEISVIWDLSEAEERKVRKKDLEKSLLIWRK